jgi:parvulin-like peptidyl-prolyl isomerase
MNNLTQMNVTIYLPLLDELIEGLKFQTLKENSDDFKEDNQQAIQLSKEKTNQTIERIQNNNLISKSELKSLSDSLHNPFDYLASLFKDTQLININQKNINLKIPMIYSEDVESYSNYLKLRQSTNL